MSPGTPHPPKGLQAQHSEAPALPLPSVTTSASSLGKRRTWVAQYIKFEMPVLDSFVEKLKEEEEREIIKLTMK
ncbi:hypothetical protein P7K49_023593 [Saguinus oedipus]|uniref:SARAH domain-containing protein n=1 Tax=Saguinus oedipus TaxID=9490 RepID=A0ABQ9UM33_SAGOE|nr:hypothetical protein P7K49_023593 [Saguinus oedipus]